MRLPKPQDLQPLLKLTRVREQAAMAELGKVAARRNAAAERVAELKGRKPRADTPDEAAILEKWLIWRDQEMRARQGHLAKCTAEYAVTAKTCGRLIAEHVVVENLTDQAEHKARTEKESRRLEALNLLSHLLAHNVGDQDV